jgi:hypothetical protein
MDLRVLRYDQCLECNVMQGWSAQWELGHWQPASSAWSLARAFLQCLDLWRPV